VPTARALAGVLARLSLSLAVAGCVAAERRELAEARRAYDECTQQRSDRAGACEVEAARLRDAEQRYESNARRAWGCDPRAQECPVDR